MRYKVIRIGDICANGKGIVDVRIKCNLEDYQALLDWVATANLFKQSKDVREEARAKEKEVMDMYGVDGTHKGKIHIIR